MTIKKHSEVKAVNPVEANPGPSNTVSEVSTPNGQCFYDSEDFEDYEYDFNNGKPVVMTNRASAASEPSSPSSAESALYD